MLRVLLTVSAIAISTVIAVSPILEPQAYAAPGRSGDNASGNGGGKGGSPDAGRSGDAPGLSGNPSIGNGFNGQANPSANGIFNGILNASPTALNSASTTSPVGAFREPYAGYLNEALGGNVVARASAVEEMANLLKQYSNVEINTELINAINNKLFEAGLLNSDPAVDLTLADDIYNAWGAL